MRPAAAAATATAAALRLCAVAILSPPPPPAPASRLLASLSVVPLLPLRRLCSSAPPHAAAAAAADFQPPPRPSPVMDAQFESFRSQLDESSTLRDRIRAVVAEIESASRVATAALLLVHQPVPLADVLGKAKAQVVVIKGLYAQLAEILKECPGQYYRYHGDWRSETQAVVSMLAFMHWLETGGLLMHTEAQEKLGLSSGEFGLDVEDYLTVHHVLTGRFALLQDCASCPMNLCVKVTSILDTAHGYSMNVYRERVEPMSGANDFSMNFLQPRFVVNRVTAGDYDCPRKVLSFLTDLHASFRMLNLRNDFLRKKFDGMKYDLRRVEEVYYDVKIRGLASAESKQEAS
ncbi:hypothetical protein EJB05_22169, partial [Eragrostis curvula]